MFTTPRSSTATSSSSMATSTTWNKQTIISTHFYQTISFHKINMIAIHNANDEIKWQFLLIYTIFNCKIHAKIGTSSFIFVFSLLNLNVLVTYFESFLYWNLNHILVNFKTRVLAHVWTLYLQAKFCFITYKHICRLDHSHQRSQNRNPSFCLLPCL